MNRTTADDVGVSVEESIVAIEIRCTWDEFGQLMKPDRLGWWARYPERVKRVLGAPRAQRALQAFEAGEHVMLVPSAGGGLIG